jgi:hypothetical protein
VSWRLTARAALPHGATRERVGSVVRRGVSLLSILCALTGFAATPLDSRILFAAGAPVPRSVQAFAWHVIETRCGYQAYEREQRSFLAYDARAVTTGAGVVYSIHIRSDLTWKKSEPPAFITMTMLDEGALRLTALKSTFVVCRDARATGAPDPR